MIKIPLNEAFRQLADKYQFDYKTLVQAASDTPYVDLVNGSKWPIGSILPNERRFLYALIRVLKPRHALECGTYWGCSTTMILSAMARNNTGHLVSIDRMENAGGRIPKQLKNRWHFEQGQAQAQLRLYHVVEPVDFFFEDTDHTRETTSAIFAAALPLMKRGGFMVAHDPVSRPAVIAGLRDVGIDPDIYLLEGSDCGVALWQVQ